MAVKYFSYFLFVLFIKATKMADLRYNMPETVKEFNTQSHLKFESVQKYCIHRDDACRSNNTKVCGVKMVNQKRFYKDFINGCYLFLSNMCDHPHEEYFIISSGSCAQFLALRRSNESEPNAPNYEINDSNETDFGDNETDTENLRKGKAVSKLYDYDTSFDGHFCPHSCPNIYSPICMNLNRGSGAYFKILYFINHCAADLYYCKNWKEFMPPPNGKGNLKISPISWSYCGSYEFLQFARTSEIISSMGHYGWLAGDYKYSHIMEPHQRIPGYGKKQKRRKA